MSISRSERYVYFQNQANHYHRLRNIKSGIDKSPPKTHIPKPRVFRTVSYNQQHDIEVENQHLISRLVGMAKCRRTEVSVDGSYSRFHKVQRPFREQSPRRSEEERYIAIDNGSLKNRLKNVKPAVGSTHGWNKDYAKCMGNMKNMSRYMESNKSKGELSLQTGKFVPKHLKDYAMRRLSMNGSGSVGLTKVPAEKQLQLPQISKRDNNMIFHFNEVNSNFKRPQSQATVEVHS